MEDVVADPLARIYSDWRSKAQTIQKLMKHLKNWVEPGIEGKEYRIRCSEMGYAPTIRAHKRWPIGYNPTGEANPAPPAGVAPQTDDEARMEEAARYKWANFDNKPPTEQDKRIVEEIRNRRRRVVSRVAKETLESRAQGLIESSQEQGVPLERLKLEQDAAAARQEIKRRRASGVSGVAGTPAQDPDPHGQGQHPTPASSAPPASTTTPGGASGSGGAGPTLRDLNPSMARDNPWGNFISAPQRGTASSAWQPTIPSSSGVSGVAGDPQNRPPRPSSRPPKGKGKGKQGGSWWASDSWASQRWRYDPRSGWRS